MNTIFDINRFIKLEKRNIISDRMQYLYIAGALGGLYLISTLLFVVVGFSLGYLIPLITISTIVFSPCLLGKNIGKNNSIFDFMLPASTFEKFLSLFLKYVVLIPFVCFLVLFVFSGISSILPVEVLNAHVRDLDLLSDMSWYKVYKVITIQSVFFLGYFYFRRYAFAKVCLSLILFSLLLSTIAGIIFALYSAEIIGMGNHGSLEYNFGFGGSNKSEMNHILFGLIVPIGMWVVAFFKLRETEI